MRQYAGEDVPWHERASLETYKSLPRKYTDPHGVSKRVELFVAAEVAKPPSGKKASRFMNTVMHFRNPVITVDTEVCGKTIKSVLNTVMFHAPGESDESYGKKKKEFHDKYLKKKKRKAVTPSKPKTKRPKKGAA